MTAAAGSNPASMLASALHAQHAAERLEAYLQITLKWQAVHNLTGARDAAALAELAADCAPLLDRARALSPRCAADLGSGAGQPGMLLALACPELPVVLIESRASKAAFLQQAAIELKTGNVQVAACRIEDWDPPGGAPDLLIARALAPLAQLCASAQRFTQKGARLLALKARNPAAECRELEQQQPRWLITGQTETGSAPSRWLVEAQAVS